MKGSRARFSKFLFGTEIWGILGGQKRPFLILLEFESNDFAENLSKVSSTKDLSNHVGHPYSWIHLDPLMGHIPFWWRNRVNPLGSKSQKKIVLLFSRIEPFWFQKCNKKIWTRNFPLWGHVTWDLEFFWKISKFSIFFRLFFRID